MIEIKIPEGAEPLVTGISMTVIGYRLNGRTFLLRGRMVSGYELPDYMEQPSIGEEAKFDDTELKQDLGVPSGFVCYVTGVNDEIEEGYALYTDGTFDEDRMVEADESGYVTTGGTHWANCWYALDLDQ